MNLRGKDITVTGKFLRLARLEAEGYFFLEEHPRQLVEELKQSGERIDLFTFTQRVPDTAPRYDLPMEWDNCAAVPVSTFEHWWSQQIRPEVRNRARQAEKRGIVLMQVPFSESLSKGIWRIYNETPVRAGRRFPHYGKDWATVHREAATFLDHSLFIGAFLDDTLVGFVKLTVDETGTQANLMNILSMLKHRDKAPTNALIAHSVRACAERGISYLVYQRLFYGKKAFDGIANFKKVNGFQKFDLPRYYIPLTQLGYAAWKLGLHRRLRERLPTSLLEHARQLRYDWYSRRFPTSEGSAR